MTSTRSQFRSIRPTYAWRLALLALCASWVSCHRAASSPKPDAMACGPRIEGLEGLLRPGATILVGDHHGTQELPQALGDIACRALQKDIAVEIGLEMPDVEQARIDAFLNSPGSESDKTAFTNSPTFWAVPVELNDGRESRAAFGLFERMRVLRRQGAPVDMFGMTTSATDYDEGMASSFLARRAQHPNALFLAFAGPNHTRRNDDYPMGARLVRQGVTLISLNPIFSGGTAWNCTGNCGVVQVEKTAPEWGSKRFVNLYEQANHAFDGDLYVGVIHATEPLNKRH